MCDNDDKDSTCHLRCAFGYSGVASDPHCLDDGLWSSVGGCSSSAGCPAYTPSVNYTVVSCSDKSLGATCMLRCNEAEGYSSNATVVSPICLPSSQWSSPSGCTKNGCSMYQPPVGYTVVSSCTDTAYGAVCPLKCTYGGNAIDVVCLSSGQWSNTAGCTSSSSNIDDGTDGSVIPTVEETENVETVMAVGGGVIVLGALIGAGIMMSKQKKKRADEDDDIEMTSLSNNVMTASFETDKHK